MATRDTTVTVPAGTLIKIEGIGIYLRCALNDPEFGCQPYVTVNTEDLPPAHRYGENNGMPIVAVHLNDCTLYDDEGAGYKTDLRPDGSFGGNVEVYVVRPDDAMAGAWAFVREEDADAMAKTYDDENGNAYADVERVTVCDADLAAKMIAERQDEDEGDGPSCERCHSQPAATCECDE